MSQVKLSSCIGAADLVTIADVEVTQMSLSTAGSGEEELLVFETADEEPAVCTINQDVHLNEDGTVRVPVAPYDSRRGMPTEEPQMVCMRFRKYRALSVEDVEEYEAELQTTFEEDSLLLPELCTLDS